MSKKHDVVITGIGLVTPVGNDVKTTWNSLINGQSGLSYLDRFDLGDYPCKIFGLVKNEKELLDKIFPPQKQRKTDRFIHLAMLAGHQALTDAGRTKEFPENRERFGTYLGIGIGGISSIEKAVMELNEKGMKKTSPFLIPKAISNQACAWLNIEWNLQGQSCAITNACSSSGDSVGMAFRMIRDGYADYMLTGGTECSITPLTISAFGNMRALCTWNGDPAQSSRPFDKDRSGFVLSEGAALLVLERKDLAIKRGANIYAEIIGYGATSDAHHIVSMHPEGRGAVKAIDMALNDAQINKTQVDYINAHGTATKMNDPMETIILKKAFGDHVKKDNSKRALISSTKSMTGHLLGAAGGLEISTIALSLKNQILPPTINLHNPDPACDLDYIANVARSKKIEYAISNSFGFGGGNSVVVLKKV